MTRAQIIAEFIAWPRPDGIRLSVSVSEADQPLGICWRVMSTSYNVIQSFDHSRPWTSHKIHHWLDRTARNLLADPGPLGIPEILSLTRGDAHK